MASYFGYSSSGHVAGAPEQCSWVGREEEGNTGPCYNGRAPYGVPSTLLRFILDRYGPSYAGGEAALMRELTGSASAGYASLTSATGENLEWLLTLFSMVLWGDGLFSNLLTSWNIYDVFQGWDESTRLQPYISASAMPSLAVSVRAGSSSFLEWSPPASHAPTSLRIRTPGGSTLPSHMSAWLLRIR